MSSIVWGWFQIKQICERIQVILAALERLWYTADSVVITRMGESIKLPCLLITMPKRESTRS